MGVMHHILKVLDKTRLTESMDKYASHLRHFRRIAEQLATVAVRRTTRRLGEMLSYLIPRPRLSHLARTSPLGTFEKDVSIRHCPGEFDLS